jgi:hypothetical protein
MTTRLLHPYWPGLALICSLALFTSCYHWGTPGVKPGTNIAVASIANDTSEGALAVTMRQKLQEHFANQPGVSCDNRAGASDYVLKVRLMSISTSGVARSEVRDKRVREDDANAYQTVLYRIELKAAYELFLSGDLDKPILSRDVLGSADLPRMHDRNVPLQVACRQAADDVARKIVADIVDQESLPLAP